MSARHLPLALLVLALSLLAPGARAEGLVPPSTELPPVLGIDDALHIFRARGLELLVADASVRSAEGSVKVAGAVPNPIVTGSVGNAITYNASAASEQNCLQNGATCPPWIYSAGLTDSAALEDTLAGKRELRLKVARLALAAAKTSRVDAERTLAFQVESAYLQVAQATLGLKFAKEVADSNTTILQKFQIKYAAGAINDGDLARMETQKAESDQALDT
ncbi:MAG: TolC family protein, partial [Myxococcales bacterium]|nr:TolC family protein [Myxococcales bacterium]